MSKICFFVIASFLFCYSANAGKPIHLPSSEILSIGNSVSYHEDKSGSIKINEIVNIQFNPSIQEVPNFGSTSSAIWFKLELEISQPGQWLLEVGNPILQQIDFYLPDSLGNLKRWGMGADVPYETRIHKVKNFLFPIPVNSAGNYVGYLRIKSNTVLHSSLKIGRLEQFLEAYHSKDLVQGIYYGFIILMVLYNLLIFFSVRDIAYLYYVGYVASVGLFVGHTNGYTFQYFPNSLDLWKDPVLIAAITCIFATLFTSSFLNTRKQLPYFHKGLNVILFLLIVVIVIDKLGFPIGGSNFLKAIIFFGPIYIYIISILLFVKGYRPAKFYMIAWTFILIANMLTSLYFSNLIPFSELVANAIQIGSSIEILLLSFALADKINLLKKEKEEAQDLIVKELREKEELKDKVNKELEQKVEERTIDLKARTEELLDANNKLRLLTDQLNKMNAKLDVDNWELKKEIKEKTKAMILAEEITYEEFLKAFPDELTCMRILEEMKWADQYQCRKCGSKSFSEGIKKFSRKCNRCDYIESVTAFTLFHGIKFPLNKAFYMTYVASQSRSKYSIRQLAALVDIRPNTCSTFLKKVEERKAKLLNKSGKKEVENWEHLVLDTLD